MQRSYVYMLSNRNNEVLYIGVTSNLQRRIIQHRNSLFGGFTTEYNCTKLVYVEEHPDIRSAIAREKQLKRWKREWKDRLIDEVNPYRRDLMP